MTGRWRAAVTATALTVCASAVALAPATPALAACDTSRVRYDNPVTETPWPLRRLQPNLVWPLSQGEGVRVAVIDSGVTADHPSLAGAVLAGKDYVDQTNDGRCDEAAHGSIVAGVIAGRPVGAFSGIAPKATVLPIRVLRDTERTSDATIPQHIVEAIVFAADNGADVINMSLVTPDTPALKNAVQYALGRGVVIVAAAGNEGGSKQEGPAFPAAYDGVIAVAGVDEEGKHVDTSTSGTFVDVAAPGANVLGPTPAGGGFAEFKAGGTSFAAAYVSGLAALLRGQDPKLTPAQVAARITSTADHPPEGFNIQVGYGVVNPLRALTVVQQAVPSRTAAAAPATLERPAPPHDPFGGTRTAAVITAVTLGGLTVVLLLAAASVRRARALRARM
ncbi:type VII secretion-associated serine protease [Virgisporangium aliadipatigenens]|uniref:Type VII secretion-associated serine protease n=1 Tax=Virgisporangium aliadipatigenens TaxID=741659 RepID=A0A8J4DV11_9ACTN|nr:type VII secretion-associated serine protease mycosin [Virgisporangium aliadipatigenens]GIJ49692.1 type VII secretion-associated serine protease [Virgisporangium aliadipatigenens]